LNVNIERQAGKL